MIEVRQLPCGVRLVMEKLPERQSASIGIWVGAGSARETGKNNGVSHFIEHMFFKGTKTRDQYQLARDTDDLGCDMNAFTGKEATCFHIKALSSVFPEAVDILLDMLCNSLFDEAEMEKERGVILEEFNMVCDTPDDYIMDLLDEKVFRRTPLAKPVLGSRSNIRGLRREDILDYIQTWYTRDNIVVSVVGNFDEERLASQLDEKLSAFGAHCPAKRKAAMPEVPGYTSLKKDINQTHIALGIPTIALDSPDYYAQAVVCDVLGGSMSSRLFQNIRERKGLAYSEFSASESYAAGGQFYIYAAVKPDTEAEVLAAIGEELKGLAAEGISQHQTEVVKQRLKSGFIFSLESTNSRMYRLGKNMLLLGRTYTEEETMAEIDAVTQEQVNRFAQRIADIRRYSGAAISPLGLEWEELWNGSQGLNGSAKRS